MRRLGRWVCACALAGLMLAGLAAAAAPGSQFQPYQAFDVGSRPAAAAIGDVTGDGRDDVVMTTDYGSDPANDFRLWVFAQTPGGDLASPVSYATAGTYGYWLDSIAIADITGDGRMDVVLGVTQVGVQVFPQLPSDALGQPTLYPTSNGRVVKVGQLDGDGRPDVAAVGWGTNTVSVLLNDGTGGFRVPVEYPAQHAGYDDLEVVDVTGDGFSDLVVMSGQLYAAPNVSVLTRLPAGGFSSPAEYRVGQNILTHGIGVGDVTGDGLNDVVASYGGNRPDSNLAVFAQTQSGVLAPPASYASYDIPEPVELADVDLDGRHDVVVLHGGWLKAGLYRQQSNGGLGPEELYSIPYASHYGPGGLAVGDVNADGSADIVLADSNDGLVVLRNVDGVPTRPPPPPAADFSVALTASATSVKPKKSFWIDAAVRNAGPDATSATVRVQLSGSPSGLSENSSSCTLQNAVVTCAFADLAAGSSVSVRISGSAPSKGGVTATATVDGAVDDPNPANDQATVSIQVH